MSGSPFGIGEFLGAQQNADAIEHASDVEAAGTQAAIDMQLQMWEQAQSDFAPFLQYGTQGLSQLTNMVPTWMSQTFAPAYNELMGFNYSNLPNASNYMVDPVTGQQTFVGSQSSTSSNKPTVGNTQVGQAQFLTQNNGQIVGSNVNQGRNVFSQQGAQNANALVQNMSSKPSTLTGAYINGQWVNEADIPKENLQEFTTKKTDGRWEPRYSENTDEWGNVTKIQTGTQYVPGSTEQVKNPNYVGNLVTITDPSFTSGQNQIISGGGSGNAGNLLSYQPLNPQQQTDYSVPNLTSNYSTGGVLSPLVPDFQRSLDDFQFDTNDPYYQTRLKQKNEQIDAFLAKQGLAGSTAGDTYRGRQMDDFTANEFDRQYGRALTERNYLTQTDIDKYNLEAARGNTLYSRTTDQLNNLYNRQYNTTATNDANRLALLQQRYGTAGNVYNALYGTALDAAKIGQGAASSTGSGALSTGNAVANLYQTGGTNQANALMAQGQVWQNFANGLSSSMGNTANSIMNYMGNTGGNSGYGNYYGGGGNYLSSGYSSNPYNVGEYGTTAFGM